MDFLSLSASNRKQLCLAAQSLGPCGIAIQQRVEQTLFRYRKHREANPAEQHCPKRRCLKHWSAELGADCARRGGYKVSPAVDSAKFSWHSGAFLLVDESRHQVLRGKPGEHVFQAIAGRAVPVDGANDLERKLHAVAVSPQGVVFVAECDGSERRLFRFEGLSGEVLLQTPGLLDVCCSPNGIVYVLDDDGRRVQQLEGSSLKQVVAAKDDSKDEGFDAHYMYVSEQEVIYLTDFWSSRVLKISPGSSRPAVIADLSTDPVDETCLGGLCVTEDETVYVADSATNQVYVVNSGDTAGSTLDLDYADDGPAVDVQVYEGSLYVLHSSRFGVEAPENPSGGVYRYILPARLDFDSEKPSS